MSSCSCCARACTTSGSINNYHDGKKKLKRKKEQKNSLLCQVMPRIFFREREPLRSWAALREDLLQTLASEQRVPTCLWPPSIQDGFGPVHTTHWSAEINPKLRADGTSSTLWVGCPRAENSKALLVQESCWLPCTTMATLLVDLPVHLQCRHAPCN